MELAISTMRQGELSKFLIAPEFAYGKYGCGKRIPPDSESKFLISKNSFGIFQVHLGYSVCIVTIQIGNKMLR